MHPNTFPYKFSVLLWTALTVGDDIQIEGDEFYLSIFIKFKHKKQLQSSFFL